MGVIGVVAVLTLGHFVQNYNEKKYINRLNSTYTILSEAVKMMVQNEGTVDTWGSSRSERMEKLEEMLPKYLHVAQICPKGKRGCIGYNFKNRFDDSTTVAGVTGGYKTYLLKNGVGLKIVTNGGSQCTQDMTISVPATYRGTTPVYYGTYSLACGEIMVDLTGPAGPNTVDMDMFLFKVVTDGIVPAGSSKECIHTDTFDSRCIADGTRGMCTAWVIYNKNMDYLHCPDKLGWDKAKSCEE